MKTIFFLLGFATFSAVAQSPSEDIRMHTLIKSVSADRIGKDITTLANFGTRHTMSDTLSETRGIGAARRWIKKEFEKISAECGGCLEVKYHKGLVKAGAVSYTHLTLPTSLRV